MKKPVLMVLVLAAIGLAAASPDEVASDISQRIMSPYCPGVTLHDCSSAQAVELRDRIEGWARDGLTEGQIQDRLVVEFGPQILAVPPTRGFNLLAWIVPAVVTLVGGAAAMILARRWRTKQSSPPPPISSADRHRIEKELRALEHGP